MGTSFVSVPIPLEEIQQGALDSSVSLADTLRKVMALGGETGSAELRGWASRELKGYGGIDLDALPDYRKPAAPLKLDALKFNAQITGQTISPRMLPDFVRDKVNETLPLYQGIGEIEAMVARARGGNGEIKLMPNAAQDIVSYMNHEIQNSPQGDPYQTITALYWSVSQVTLEGVVDQVRTILVELVAEMKAATPRNVATPSAAVADQAVNVAVYGKKASVNVNTAQASGDGSHHVQATPAAATGVKRPWWMGLWGAVLGVATLLTTAAAIAAVHWWPF